MASERRNLINEMLQEYPWLPRAVIRTYVDYYIEHGDEDTAWIYTRADDVYQQHYPAMLREDGSLRYNDEQEYMAVFEGYQLAIESVGVNAGQFTEDIIQAMIGDKSLPEFRTQLNTLAQRVLESAPEIRAFYREQYGIELSRAGMIAGLMSPGMGNAILNRQITQAEIAGEASMRDLELDLELVERLFESGMDRAGAARYAAQVQDLLPTLNVLAKRHADPDDDFDINEFTAANVFDDPYQRRRLMRLVNAERMSFAESGGLALYRDQMTGGLAGLE